MPPTRALRMWQSGWVFQQLLRHLVEIGYKAPQTCGHNDFGRLGKMKASEANMLEFLKRSP